MINKALVSATMVAFSNILESRGVEFALRDDEETRFFKQYWDEYKDKEHVLRQAAPAAERIASREPYLFLTDGDPLVMRLNYLDRQLERDSFGEILFERPDLDWRFAISIKNNARVLASMPFADRKFEHFEDKTANKFNAIDDFGTRIFDVPCSNDYFIDMNEILLNIAPHDDDSWGELIKDERFIYGKLITPMIGAIGRELPRIFMDHPEAPAKLLDYFYGKIDYYYINPIEELRVTRIGAVNSRGGLGRIPDNDNLYTAKVDFPTKLLDVRLATGKYGELSRDTIQFTFDGGWAICIRISPVYPRKGELDFDLKVYLPVTPYGSYRDQVDWYPGE